MISRCVVDECDKEIFVIDKSFCRLHYHRWWRHGDPLILKQIGPLRKSPSEYPKVCCVEKCEEAHHALGYCQKHYMNFRKYGKPISDFRAPNREFDRCQIEGCTRVFFCKKMCRSHYQTIRGGPTRATRKEQGYVPFTAEQLNSRLEYYGHKCWMCQGPYEALDHVKPLSKGGFHVLSNLRPSCRSCNSSKSDKWPLEEKQYV